MSDPERRAFAEVANLYGIETRHVDGLGRQVEVGSDALLALLRALGAPVESAADFAEAARLREAELQERVLEPVLIHWEGEEVVFPLGRRPDGVLAWSLTQEDGEVLRGEVSPDSVQGRAVRPALDRPLPLGYHRLELQCRAWSAGALLVSAPVLAHSGPGGPRDRRWGAFLPLHSLYSRDSWEIGDLGDLGRLASYVGKLGASALGCLPLLPTFLDRPFDPSPYAPLSRRFWNEVYLDPRRLPGFERSAAAREVAASGCFQAPERSPGEERGEVRYRRAMALKRKVCAVLAREQRLRGGEEAERVRRFEADRPLAGDYAEFRALNDRLGSGWQEWPERLREGRVEAGDFDPDDRWLHLWMQSAVDAQLRETARLAAEAGAPLYLDFPVGVHSGGFDVWRERGLFALGASAGAPPDSLFTGGQDWGLPPLHPERLRTDGYSYWIEALRHHLAPAGLLRIDHVMQLQRLYWVPAGFPATEGAYVRQPVEELLAILCLESVRHRTAIVGENLGTVPAETGEALRRHGLRGLYVLQYELSPDRPPAPPPVASVAGLNTHDMPTFRGFCEGRDLDELAALGLLPEAGRVAGKEERAALLRALRQQARAVSGEADEVPVADLLRRQLVWLAESPASWVLVNLEDLWGEGEPQNVPGTSFERPNWRRKAALGLEEIEVDPQVAVLLREVDRRRRGSRVPPPTESLEGPIEGR